MYRYHCWLANDDIEEMKVRKPGILVAELFFYKCVTNPVTVRNAMLLTYMRKYVKCAHVDENLHPERL